MPPTPSTTGSSGTAGVRRNWLNLRELEIFRAVIDARKTTAAALRLGISQPAVSRALSQLEARTGRLLFERDAGRLKPTAEALALNRELDPLFETLARLDQQEWQGASVEPLRIAAPPTLAHRLLQPLIAGYAKLNPDQVVSLEISATDPVVLALAERRADLGLIDSAVSHAGVHLEPILRSHAVCIMPGGHRLTALERVRPPDLAGEAFVALTRRHSTRSVIDQIFIDHGVERRIAIETATTVSAAEFVRDGLGVALINPVPIVGQLGAGIEVRPFEPAVPYQTSLVLSANAPMTAAARSFAHYLRRNLPADDYSTALS